MSEPSGASLRLPAELPPDAAGRIRLRIKRVVIDGSSVYDAAALAPLSADIIGRQVPATAVYAVANSIVEKYGRDGYSLVRAVVVPQEVSASGAVVRIRVIEGYIERVEWPAEAKRYPDLFSGCIAAMTQERPIRTKTIERCLLLANDLPGLRFTSTLKAGHDPHGGTVLVVALTEKPFDVLARVDNRGTPGRGPWEYLTSITENNRLHLNESLNITYASAFDPDELRYISGTYHQALNASGLAFDVTGYSSKGTPNLPSLNALNFRGNTEGVEAGFSYPFIRSREQNLFLSGLFFAEHAYSDLLDAPNTDDELRGFRLRANYDEVDSWLGAVGQSQAIVTFSQGIDGLGSSSNHNALASVANGRVDFSKIEATVSRTQAIGRGFSAYGAAYGQYAGSAVLVPEQCGYGGQYFGRAFDAYELAGDRCFDILGELRYDVAIPRNPLSETQLYGFVDHGDVYRVDAAASTPSHMDGTSAGAGLRLAWQRETATADNVNLDLQAAKPVDGRLDDAWRYFLTFSAHY